MYAISEFLMPDLCYWKLLSRESALLFRFMLKSTAQRSVPTTATSHHNGSTSAYSLILWMETRNANSLGARHRVGATCRWQVTRGTNIRRVLSNSSIWASELSDCIFYVGRIIGVSTKMRFHAGRQSRPAMEAISEAKGS